MFLLFYAPIFEIDTELARTRILMNSIDRRARDDARRCFERKITIYVVHSPLEWNGACG